MSNIDSEKLIYELTKELTEKNIQLNKDKIYNTISKIILGYGVKKLNQSKENNLISIIETYLAARKLDGVSDSTLKGYRIQLTTFAKDINKDVELIRTADIRVHLAKFEKLKKSSMATKVSVLKTFFSWLFTEEIIEKNPMDKIKTPKFNKFLPRYLEIDELEMLRESCKTLRERAMVEVLYATGLRVSELRSLNIEDIDFVNFSANVVGKGNKEREVLFSLKAIHHLQNYLDSRNDNNNALFVSERKPYNRLTTRGIERAMQKISERTDIKKKITPHVLRHSFATLSLNNNMDISIISKLMGHSKISTTQIYSHVTDENKRHQYRKYLVL